MQKFFFLLCTCFLLPLLAEETFTWDYTGGEWPLNCAGITMKLADEKTPDGKPCLEIRQPISPEQFLYSSQIQFPFANRQLRNGTKIRISFWIKGEPKTQFLTRCAEMVPYSTHHSETLTISLTGAWQHIEQTYTLRDMTFEAYMAFPRMILSSFVPNTPIYIGPLSIETLEK